MTHVVIPAAGEGRRFIEAGYPPKTHVLVDGVPMLRRVVENIRAQLAIPHRVTVVVTSPPPTLDDVDVLQLAQPTRGAAETILAAGIDDQPLIVANCDQLVSGPWILTDPADGWIATFTSDRPHHSYVQVDADGFVEKIAEKQVISDQAVAGVYVFKDGTMFAGAARAVIDRDERVLGEFYVSTVLAEMVARGARLRTFPLDVTILGTPEELERYATGRTR
jgi:bifunctional N-acetylglucosamine-1-phosphate-uridyltransferase/glucosamine-1-phosphate-acetyltransferase GlmU-like protein